MFWMAPRWRRGALRYQSSLNARSVARLARPFGKASGKVSSCGASNFSGSSRSFAGSWSRVAREPRVSTARPSFAPVVVVSNQAAE